MADVSPINPGQVEWSGENPGIYLQDREDGPWTTLATFFRIVASGHGRGHALILLEAPTRDDHPTDACNICIADNMPLAKYLVTDFVAKFPSFSVGRPALRTLRYEPLTDVASEGDAIGFYAEHVRSDSFAISLKWEELGQPIAMHMPVELTGTREHEMYSVLVESRRASITVNGRILPGRLGPRSQASLRTTSAFLYFSETWVRPRPRS